MGRSVPGARRAVLPFALACAAGCGAELAVGGDRPDAPAPADAAPDAAPCTGGDAALRSPTGKCLFLITAPATYADAQAGCTSRSARLAQLRNPDDDQAARTLAASRDAFFGLDDRANEGSWVWADGAGLTYMNWYMGEPNDGGGTYPEDCAVINGARGGAWDDRPCEPIPNVGGGLYAYLCES